MLENIIKRNKIFNAHEWDLVLKYRDQFNFIKSSSGPYYLILKWKQEELL